MVRNLLAMHSFTTRDIDNFVMVLISKLELFLLKEGETLEAKAVELVRAKIGIADMATARAWIVGNPDICRKGPIVIADPFSDPRIISSSPLIVQVPAHSIDGKGEVSYDGWIDLLVPMWPAAAGGQLAILGIHSA